jgi:methionyl-tRNA synthetase
MGFSDEQMPHLLVHGFWSLRGEKVSKSTGNVVDPATLAETYGTTALRYYLMRDAVMGRDADFSEERLLLRHNTELGNGLGNLVNRTLSMSRRYREGSPKQVTLPADLVAHLEADVDSLEEFIVQMDAAQIHAGIEIMVDLVNRANALVDSAAPWKLAKDPEQAERLDAVLSTLILSSRTAATLLLPVAPEAAAEILRQLDLPAQDLDGKASAGLPDGYRCGEPKPVFPRLEIATGDSVA